MLNRPKPLVLLILDGFGYSVDNEYNAIATANTPCWDKLQKDNPMTLIHCSGTMVGLPDDQMGNSEVGHIHIGAGRYVPQDFSKVSDAIKDKSFFTNPVLLRAVNAAKENGKALHVMGLPSPGGVHSHENQIMAMVELAARNGLDNIYIHAFLDGRDVPPKSAASSIELMEAKIKEPEMSAPEVTDRLIEAITGGQYDVIICNYANCDMVGPTGVLEAAIAAVETVDGSLQRIHDALTTIGGRILLTADHGNIEHMRDQETGQPHTAHTTNQVPLVNVCGDKPLASGGSLSDLAATILDILGVDKTIEISGRSLAIPV